MRALGKNCALDRAHFLLEPSEDAHVGLMHAVPRLQTSTIVHRLLGEFCNLL